MPRLLSVGLSVGVLVVGLASGRAAGQDLSVLFPEDVIAYAECRSPKAVSELLETWLSGFGGNRSPLDSALDGFAGGIELEPGQKRTELKKVRCVAIGVTRIDRETEEPVVLVIAEMGEARVLRDAIKRALADGREPAETVREFPIYGDREGNACVLRNYVVFATHLEEVRRSIKRIAGENQPDLARSERFRKAMAGRDADSPLFGYVDVSRLHAFLRETEAENDDFAALDAALDLKTVDVLSASLGVKDAVTVLRCAVLFSGENRTYAALRSPAAERSVTRFFSGTYGLVCAGTLADGRAQWRSFKDIVARVEMLTDGDDDFVSGVAELEEALKVNVGEELANVREYGLGVRAAPKDWGGEPDVLIVLKVGDVERARGVMAKVEAAAKAGDERLELREMEVEGVTVRLLAGEEVRDDYAWAAVGRHVLMGNRSTVVSEAVRTHLQNKCLLDEPGARKVLENLHAANSKLVLVNWLGFLPPMPRNPHAPPPGMLGVSAQEEPGRLEIRADFSRLGDLIQMYFKAVGTFAE